MSFAPRTPRFAASLTDLMKGIRHKAVSSFTDYTKSDGMASLHATAPSVCKLSELARESGHLQRHFQKQSWIDHFAPSCWYQYRCLSCALNHATAKPILYKAGMWTAGSRNERSSVDRTCHHAFPLITHSNTGILTISPTPPSTRSKSSHQAFPLLCTCQLLDRV